MLLQRIRRFVSSKFNRQFNWQFHRMASTLPKLPIFEAISGHDPRSIAVVHSSSGQRFAYGDLLRDVAVASSRLRHSAGGKNLDGQRIAFLTENSYDYVGTSFDCIRDNFSQH